RPGGRPLEHAASGSEAPGSLCNRYSAKAARRSGRRGERLHEDFRRPVEAAHAKGPRVPGPRHRRLRPLRYASQAAALLRGRPQLRHDRGAESACRSGRGQAEDGRRCAQEIRHRCRQAGPDDRMSQVVVPDIGDFKEVEVIEVLVKPGDAVSKEQSLITLESDKATMEIPSPAAGVVKEIRVKIGDKVSRDTPILVLKSKDQALAEAPKPAAPKAAAPAPAPAPIAAPAPRPVPREPQEEATAKPHASPSVRKFARELGV